MSGSFALDWRFMPVFEKVDYSTAFSGSYELVLVATSLAIAVLAALVALSTSSRITAARSLRARWAWTAAGAISMGGGIWAMHFIGMLAFSLPCGVTYDPVGTVLSMIPGMLASGIALSTISKSGELGLKELTISAVLMGAGIGAMHYTGMAAMQPEARLLYDPALVALSVIVAIVLAFISLSIRFRLHLFASGTVATVIAATIMGCAVAGMHYTAMQASLFFPLPDAPVVTSSLSTPLLAFLIAVFTMLIAFSTLSATFAGRQNELALSLKAEIARRETTEQDLVRAREQAEAANRAKSRFVATVSHEIRTPMNGVLGMAHLLGSTTLNERQRRLVENLSRSGKALLATIHDILDFSRIEAGRIELIETEFNPREVIAEVTDLFCEPCAAKGLELVYFVDEQVPYRVNGDAVKLRQVLINLVGNALKFTERGEIVLEVTAAAGTDDVVSVVFTVTDSGIGIAPEHQQFIFNSFYQAGENGTRGRGGSGLGLTIAKNLVEMMGGRIELESRLQVGSRFQVTVPLRRSDSQEHAGPTQMISWPYRVLLVDANASSRRVLSSYLTSWRIDHEVCRTVADAEHAWLQAVTNGHPFAVAVVDIKGCGSAGLLFARKIAEAGRNPRADVIALTGIEALVTEEADNANFFAVLTKPPRPSELYNCFASLAGGGRAAGVVPFVTRRAVYGHKARFDARVLVAEDNPVNQDVAVGMLEAIGCQPDVVSDGHLAIEAFAKERYDLILMDCEMPIMDGFEATKRIRAMEEGRESRTIIVAVTAHALVAVHQKCLAAGMDDFLVKPYSDVELVAAMRRWLPGREKVEFAGESASGRDSLIIDSAVIDQLRRLERGGSNALLTRVVSQFVATAPPLVDTIVAKVDEGDGDSVWRAAHSLKSSAAAVGARQLSQCCAAIERGARDAGVGSVRALLVDLRAELKAATESLVALI